MFSFENELSNEVTAVMPQDTSNKSVQKEEQGPTNLHLQTNMNEVPRCVCHQVQFMMNYWTVTLKFHHLTCNLKFLD